jgi:hypothetical protein
MKMIKHEHWLPFLFYFVFNSLIGEKLSYQQFYDKGTGKKARNERIELLL